MKHADQHTGRVGVLPWFAACVVATALIFMNLDGYHNELFQPTNASPSFWGEPPLINWTHGWPVTCMIRVSPYWKSVRVPMRRRTGRGNDIGITSRWPFDGTPAAFFYVTPLFVDIVTLVVLVIGAAHGAYRIAAKRPIHIRFGIRFLFVVTTVVAIALAFRLPWLLPRYVPQFIAMGIAALGAATTVFGVADLVWTRLRRSG